VCGALLSGADDVEPYRAFAAELGLLFQIVDDILDETGAAEELGKSVGKDRALDKVTYVSRFGMERAAQLADETQERARVLLDELPGDTADLAAVAVFIHDRRR
jgi:geranylgeranyl diphosphate synthase type II